MLRPTVFLIPFAGRKAGMKRKLNGEKTGATRQRALLLSLETFLAITALPRSTRQERTGAAVNGKTSSRTLDKQGWAAAHQPR